MRPRKEVNVYLDRCISVCVLNPEISLCHDEEHLVSHGTSLTNHHHTHTKEKNLYIFSRCCQRTFFIIYYIGDVDDDGVCLYCLMRFGHCGASQGRMVDGVTVNPRNSPTLMFFSAFRMSGETC